jgi:putative transcriptional regulator
MMSEVLPVGTRSGPANTPLFRARKKAGLRQSDVATALGVQRVTYTHIERGTKKPSLPLALKIADFFGTTVDQLFNLEGGSG